MLSFYVIQSHAKFSDKVYFKVVEWPSAAEFRKLAGLSPKDFHITVGYTISDIHGVKKDRSTLVQS